MESIRVLVQTNDTAAHNTHMTHTEGFVCDGNTKRVTFPKNLFYIKLHFFFLSSQVERLRRRERWKDKQKEGVL